MKTIQKEIKFYLPYLNFLLPLVNNPWGIDNPSELAKFAFVGVFFAGIIAYLLVRIVLEKRFKIFRNNKICFFLALWMLSLALSTILSVAPVESFFGTYARLFGFLAYIFYLGIFLFFLQFFHDQKKQNGLIWVVIATGSIVSLYGIYQFYTLDFTSMFSPGQAFAGRIFSLLGSPNDLGQYLIFPIIATALILGNFLGAKKTRASISVGFLLALQLAALFLSANRASIIALLVAGVLWLIIRFGYKFIIPLVIVAALLIPTLSPVAEKIDLRSFNSRLILWQDTVDLAAEIPLAGTGLETYQHIIQKTLSPEIYNYEKLNSAPEAPHNVLLSVWAEQGYLGLILLMVISLAVVWKISITIRSQKNDHIFKWAFYSVVATAVTMQFSYFSHTSYLFFLAALSLILIKTFSFKTISIRIPKAAGVVSALFLLPIFAIIIIFCARLIGSDILYGSVVEAVISDTNKAVSLYAQRADTMPFYAHLYAEPLDLYGRSAIENPSSIEILGNFSEKYGWITGGDFEYHIQQGMLYYADGNASAAVIEFKTAETMAPAGFRVYYWWAVAADAADDKPSAVYALEKGLSLAPAKWRNAFDPQSLTAEEKEQYRIFSLSNPLYFALLDLQGKYEY